jgi:polyhydroxyalkanoate depolymerase
MTTISDAISASRTRPGVLYAAYQTKCAVTAPLYAAAAAQTALLRHLPTVSATRRLNAVSETVSALKLTHSRPEFGVETVTVAGERVAIREDVVAETPFVRLVHFAKPMDFDQPRVLVVPGLAGHFATLVRATVRTLLPDHDVFVTDWRNARDVPVQDGRFGLEEYIEHLISFMETIGPGGHLIALCQPCPASLAAASLMAQDDNPAQPRSIILMAGPVDSRINPGRVNRFANERSPKSLERCVTRVPWPYQGAGRRVYPGFLQALGFVGMDPRRHVSAFRGLVRDIARGNQDEAERIKDFYKEYFAVLDVTAEFYLETARAVFMEHDLPRGVLEVRGRRVDPAAITSALLTIEGANDALCPPGQTRAAHDLCTGIPEDHKRHHLQQGVGHYGVFSGTRFEREVYPQIKSFIEASEREPATV